MDIDYIHTKTVRAIQGLEERMDNKPSEKETEYYDKLRALVGELDTLTDEINNYLANNQQQRGK